MKPGISRNGQKMDGGKGLVSAPFEMLCRSVSP